MSTPESDKDGERSQQKPEKAPAPLSIDQILLIAGQRVLREQQLKTVGGIRGALDLKTDIVTDPLFAGRLAMRHNSRVRTASVAQAMYLAYYGNDEQKAAAFETLSLERDSADEDGVFLYDYSPEMMFERIAGRYADGTPRYVIAEASGSHPRQGHPRYGKPSPAADVQIHLPEAAFGAAPVFSVPETTDMPTDMILLGQMLERPHMVAQIDDIVSDTNMGRIGLASSALDAGLRKVAEMNKERGDFAIEIITAEIVMITGVRRHDGLEHMFGEEILGTPIHNERSMVLFNKFRSDIVHQFRDVVTLRNRYVPVAGHAHVKSLIVDWYVKAARFKKT